MLCHEKEMFSLPFNRASQILSLCIARGLDSRLAILDERLLWPFTGKSATDKTTRGNLRVGVTKSFLQREKIIRK